MKNPRRKVAYPGPGSSFYIPVRIWKQTLEAIQRYAPFRSEGLVFWGGGIGANDDVYVTTLYLPNHPPQGSRVRPAHQSMRQLVRSLYEVDQKLVAQTHSHPGEAFHSYGDDDNAASYHPGYLSIVVPYFGRRVTRLDQCAAYEFDGQSFCRLSEGAVAARFVFEQQIVELSPWSNPDKDSLWRNLRKKLRFIARRKR